MSHTIHGYANPVAFQIHQIVKSGSHGSHVRNLHVEIEPPDANSLSHVDAVTLTGTAGTYHVKQHAQETLRTQRFVVTNLIEVAARK